MTLKNTKCTTLFVNDVNYGIVCHSEGTETIHKQWCICYWENKLDGA